MFSGNFGDTWDRHQERFSNECLEEEIGSSEYVYYLQETLTGGALNYVESKIENSPKIPWTNLSKLLQEGYNNVNRQKEVSNRI